MAKQLVIVESPTKARTISRFLPASYVVESSIGHVRDLPRSADEVPEEVKKQPWGSLGVDIEGGFKPVYVIPNDKKKQIAKLKALMKGVETIYLATDEDREGESISWHLQEVLQPKVRMQRLVFHEITREAIAAALRSPREIDTGLVKAQETRRVLDRLYGYEVSPVLWKKIAKGLSAGRVQSVALRWIVERERRRRRFRNAEYWDLGARLQAEGGGFEATLVQLGERRVAAGRDFDEESGELKAAVAERVQVLGRAEAERLAKELPAEAWRVLEATAKPYTSSPAAPFITSTLQQEASRKLHMSARAVMGTAQALYEKGHITYMRTDSTALSQQAVQAARREIETRYGKEWVCQVPRQHRSSVRNAQEAHEAIRPAGAAFAEPPSLRTSLNQAEYRLYELIWKRTLASQMADARGERTNVRLQAGEAVFHAAGKTITFAGYLRVYVEGSDDPQAELSDQERILPPLQAGQALECRGVQAQQHLTQPPARFTEAALIKELEKRGVGRPSTYASIIETILRRDYVHKKNGALAPTFVAFAVVRLLEHHFTTLVDSDFTAQMEDTLDSISRGEQEALPYLQRFYFGEAAAATAAAAAAGGASGSGNAAATAGDTGAPASSISGLKRMLAGEIDARKASAVPLDDAAEAAEGAPVVRIGRYGPYLEHNGKRASLAPDLSPDELTPQRALELLEAGQNPHSLGQHPESGQPIYLKHGRYGPYVQLGEAGQGEDAPKMKSLPPGASPEAFSLPEALRLFTLPREVGVHPESGEAISADLGRYGPYLRMGKASRSLPDYETLFSCSQEEALALLAEPKARRWGPTILRTLGVSPQTSQEVTLCSGRFGPYVTDGQTNASLRQEDPDSLELEAALALLAERASAAPKSKPAKKTAAATRTRKTPAKKKTTATAAASLRKAPAKKKTTTTAGRLRKAAAAS